MRMIPLEKRKITSSRILFGTTGLGGEGNYDPITDEVILKAEKAIDSALSAGITMFDHADIYKNGKAEAVFGAVLKARPELRDRMVIQTKCGTRFKDGDNPHRYDFSKEHILSAVDGSLMRLHVEYVDVLLLHRPDPLVEPEEVAEAFDILKSSGKVRHFGVSNMNSAQIKLLQASCSDPLVVNQLEMSLMYTGWLDQGVLVNQKSGADVSFATGIIEHCRLKNIQIQAWSSLANGAYSGRELNNPTEEVLRTKQLVRKMALLKETSEEAIVLGWLMRHPAGIQPVIGTVNPERILRCQDAVRQAEIMSREEWYSLYEASRGKAVT
jgi:predicted oxidoreductase